MESTIDSLLGLFTIDYEKSIEVSLKLEQAKLTYQRFYISLVSIIGTISIGFLKLNVFDTNKSVANIEVLIGLLLIFSTILGYAVIQNLVSIRRQSCHFNNAIIYLRELLINKLSLDSQYPTLKKVPANHYNSADYITIILCSLVNLSMLICGTSLLFDLVKLQPLAYGFIFTLVAVFYCTIHYYTIEKVLNKTL